MVNSKKFSLFIVPPNITGDMHLGHALMVAIQDSIIRWKRLQHYDTDFFFGTDHAGISTEGVVERYLSSQGINRHELTREQFLEHVWNWVDFYDGRIRDQIKLLNVSCDWSRYLFTMSDEYSNSVLESFVRLYKKGYVYQGKYPVYLCNQCNTSLSDLEVNISLETITLHEVQFRNREGELFPIVCRKLEDLTVMSGVLLSDEGIKELTGEELLNPITEEYLPVLVDKDLHYLELGELASKRSFGVPVLLGQRKLHFQKWKGKLGIPESNRQFDRFSILLKLQETSIHTKDVTTKARVESCSRCGSLTEVRLSDQWFIRLGELGQRLKERLRAGEVVFYPETALETTIDWLENIEDWCVSRQITWGHRIPAWKCARCGEYTIARGRVKTCSRCNSPHVEQVADVLDTWFSSAHWYFANYGWPTDTEMLSAKYPADLIETGHDILFFWVIRMMLMSLIHTDQLSAREVLLHGLVLDSKGQKMSKSKGNVIKVNDLLQKFGSDVVRYGLLSRCEPGKDIRLDPAIFPQIQNMVDHLNEMIQACIPNEDSMLLTELPDHPLQSDMARWLLNQTAKKYRGMQQFFEDYQFKSMAQVITPLVNGVSKWMIAVSKQASEEEHEELRYALGCLLTLLGSLLPTTAEEGLRQLRIKFELEELERMFKIPQKAPVFDLIVLDKVQGALVRLEHDFGKLNTMQSILTFDPQSEEQVGLFRLYGSYLIQDTAWQIGVAPVSHGVRLTYCVPDTNIWLSVYSDKVERFMTLDKSFKTEIRHLNRELKSIMSRLNNEAFRANAAPEKVRDEEKRAVELSTRIQQLSASLQT